MKNISWGISWQRNEVGLAKLKYFILFFDHYLSELKFHRSQTGWLFPCMRSITPLWLLMLYVFLELQFLMCLLEVVYYVPSRLLAIIFIPLSCCLQQLMCLLAFFAFSLLSYGDRYYSTFYALACVRDWQIFANAW